MSTLSQDFRLGLRSLRRAPAFTAMVIFTLALGIGANTTIFGAVYAVLLRPLPYGDPDRIVQLFVISPQGRSDAFSPPNFNDVRLRNAAFTHVAAVNEVSYALTGDGPAEQVPAAAVTADFFGVMGVSASHGRAIVSGDDSTGAPRIAVLSHSLWSRRFGADSAILGSSIRLDGDAYEIVGIAPRSFAFPAGAELWTPLSFTADEMRTQRGANYLLTFGRLRSTATVESGSADLASIAAELAREFPSANEAASMQATALRESLTGEVQRPMLILLGAVGLVLLIACVNVANLLLVRGFGRSREIAIRSALGANTRRLIQMQLAECMLLALAGGAVGLLIAFWGTELVSGATAAGLPLIEGAGINATVVAFAVGVSLFTSLVFGLLPSWHPSRPVSLGAQLRTDSHGAIGDRKRHLLRRWLVVGELALATTLLVGAGLLTRSLVKLNSVDIGMNPEHVLTFAVDVAGARYSSPESRAEFVDRLTGELRRIPGVEHAGAVFHTPLTGFSYGITGFELDGRQLPQEEQLRTAVQVRVATTGFFDAAGIRVLRGRDFESSDRDGNVPVLIVNEAAAKLLWPAENALGRTFSIGSRMSQGASRPRAGGTVVGVVSDVREHGPRQPARPTIYLAHAQVPMGYMGFLLRTHNNPAALTDAARKTLGRLDPALQMFRVRTFDQLVAGSVAQARFYFTLLTAFAAAALLLAAIGVFGVISQGVAQRTRELGVRIALGARGRDIAVMVVSDAGILAVVGVVTGLASSYFATKLLTRLLFEVQPADTATYVTVAAVLLVVALLASWYPAQRAASVDPMRALKAE